MKKNLRIVSAAAAALLAVAPVAATSVSTVFADGVNEVTVVNGTTTSEGSTINATLTPTNVGSLTNGALASTVKLSLATPTLPSGATITYNAAKIYKADDVTGYDTDKKDGSVKFAGQANESSNVANLNSSEANGYKAIIYVTVHGLKAGQDYKVNSTQTVKANNNQDAYFAVISEAFNVPNSALTGAPYVRAREDGTATALTSGSHPLLPSEYSVKALAKALTDSTNGQFVPAVTTNKDNSTTASGAASAKFADPEGDVRTSLKAAGITVKNDSDGSFDKPAAPFVVTLSLIATNGQKATFPVTVDPNSTTFDKSYPVIKFNNGTDVSYPKFDSNNKLISTSNVIENVDSLTVGGVAINFNYIPVNGVVDTAAIKKAFSAQVNTDNTNALDVNVDTSKVNTKVAGKYPVTVSATNAEKKTTKVVFYLTVGTKGATYKTVQSDGDVPVYKIEGNTVTDTKTTVKNGDQIAVFGDPIKVGDKSYTRINSADSNLYVETKYVDGSFKPADKTKKTVMHNAYIYDKDHKRVGTTMLRAYTSVEVIGAATKLADGSLVYQIGDNQYVMADNIDGTVRTLSHNAYVYKTSKKRADRRVLRKGDKVTTFGSPYTFKNGKSYYRIGGPSKQYVKVANFN